MTEETIEQFANDLQKSIEATERELEEIDSRMEFLRQRREKFSSILCVIRTEIQGNIAQ